MGSKEDCQNDPSDTIVGMEPITIEDDEIIEIEEKTNVHTVTSFDSFNFFPVSPKSINQTGLTQTFIEELILKHIFKVLVTCNPIPRNFKKNILSLFFTT